MNRSELAARLVNAKNSERKALLIEHAELADVELAHILKDFCLDGWSSNPTQAIAAAKALTALARSNSDPEIAALCAWASGLEALVNGYMERAIESLDQSHRRFLALDKPHAAASTEVSKLIALAMLGHYDEAIACGLRAREVFLAHGDILAAGKIEHNIGNLCFRRDRYHEAEEFQVAARERFMALNDQKQLATINNCLANTHALLHKFKSAEELYEQAVRQAEAAGLPTTLAGIEGNIGNFALLQGRYDRALDYLERSRRRYASLGMPHQSATAEQEIADAYLELNLVPEAAAIYERVIPKFAELGMRAEQARALAYYGRALISLGRIEEAHAHLLSARELYAAEENEVGEAVVVLTQAQLHYQQKDYVSANRMAAEAESRLSFSGGWRRLLMARWLHGEAERALGRTGEARSILEQTLLEANLKEQPQVAERCYTSLGLVAAMTGDTQAAEQAFKQAVELTEELRAPLPGEEFRAAFFANKLEPYSELVRLCLDDGRVAEALDFVERARSRALAETLGGNPGLTVRPRDEFESVLLRQMEELSEELNYLYNQINRPRDNARESDEPTVLQNALRERENKILEISRQLQHRSEKVSGTSESFNLAELQRRLGADRALVEYATIDNELLAFVVTDRSIEAVRNLAAESEVAAEVAQFHFQIDTLRYGSAAVRKYLPTLEERARKHLEALYEKLLGPLMEKIDRRSLVIVPHRALHYLPFQALHDGARYLIEQHEISYAPSAVVLQQCLDRPRRRVNDALLLGVADELIPRVNEEIEAIKQVFPNSVSLLDKDATIDALRKAASKADVLHLACHAQFRSDNPLFSSLQLADGWFSVRDAYRLKLECDLVTLSACETGVNAIVPGDELIGLARGFFSAGSPSVLLSLWTVDDEATGQLMAEFYRQLRITGSMSGALQSAQTKLLKDKQHPFFWAPFVLVGRW